MPSPTPTADFVTPTPSQGAGTQPALERWASAWQAVASDVAESTAEGVDGNLLYTVAVRHEAPHRSPVVGRMPSGQNLKMVVIGERAWVRLGPSGTWQEVPRSQLGAFNGGAAPGEDVYGEQLLGSPGSPALGVRRDRAPRRCVDARVAQHAGEPAR